MRRLYLDDVRTPLDDSWDIVRNYRDFCVYLLEHGVPDEISFDHDLGWCNLTNTPELTGMDCAKFMVYKEFVPVKFYVHSANPVGAENILSLLNNWQAENGLRPNGQKTFWECKHSLDDIQ